ncbi:MAG: hypothetical protein K6G88_05840 [Lachnospiraceae bacterium]|nr:hypothetical protein [Lachnospiraceae bacterium]
MDGNKHGHFQLRKYRQRDKYDSTVLKGELIPGGEFPGDSIAEPWHFQCAAVAESLTIIRKMENVIGVDWEAK